jgi:hypothetical protein
MARPASGEEALMPEAKTRDSIITRIQKLLALSTSGNEHEASLAMEKAQELLTKHNLSMAEVEPLEEAPPVTKSYVSVHTRATNAWLYMLAKGIARTNFSAMLVSDARAEDGNPRTARRIMFIGREENARVCCELLGWIAPQAESWGRREKRLSGNDSGHRNSYMIGLAEGICGRLDQYRREQEAQNVGLTALVIRHDTEIREYMGRMRIGVTKTRGHRGAHESRVKGRQDADRISIVAPSRQVT